MNLFECQDVSYAYQGRFPAVASLNLTLAAGECIALVGANGSGKSTLLHLLDGLVFPDRGVIRFDGRELTEDALQDEAFARLFRRRVGLVFQNPDAQLFCPTVREDIAFGPLQLGVEPQTVAPRLAALAQDLGITHLLDRPPHQLSVGEKRKVAFATTLVIDPDVLLLDEPTAGLDPRTSTHLVELLVHAARQGKTIVMATHDLHTLEDLADKVYVIGQDKRVAACGAPAAILGDTALLQANNLIHAHPHHASDHARYHWDV